LPRNVGGEVSQQQLSLELDEINLEFVEPDGDSIVAILSHDLVTSLAVVMGSLYAFQKHHHVMPDEMRERLLSNAIEGGTELAMLLDTLLNRIDEAIADGIREGTRLPTA
jgi:K+-sensing histidine kinase KdpD